MTKEQEEAIEIISKYLNFNEICGTRNFKEALEKVLNMLKENSAEIEQKNTELAEKSAEIEKKDKIIDLMAEQIKIPEPTMKIESFDIQPKTKFGMRYLNKEEVKQYFERKAKDGRN